MKTISPESVTLKRCRICFNHSKTLSMMEKRLLKIIAECASVIIEPQSKPLICDSCRNVIDRFNELKMRCIQFEDQSKCANESIEEIENSVEHIENCRNASTSQSEIIDQFGEEIKVEKNDVKSVIGGYRDCENGFKSKMGKKRSHHKNREIQKINSENCVICLNSFVCYSSLENHWTEMHADVQPPFQCTTCSKRFINEILLTQHQSIDHCERSIENGAVKCATCQKCKEIFQSEKELNDHCLRDHVRASKMKMQCLKCSKQVTGHYSMTKHWTTCHWDETAPFKCLICEGNFFNEHVFNNHVEIRHSKQVSQCLTCTYCKKNFKTRYKFQRHMQTQATFNYKCQYGVSKTLCSHCGLSFLHLEHHQIKCHKRQIQSKTFNCRFCRQEFNGMADLIAHHKLIHVPQVAEQEFKHQCELCGRKFERRKNLLAHNLAHTQERPFPCKICTKAFKRPAELRMHVKRHADERPFSCNVCEARFMEKRKLVEHVRIHTGEKPYSCHVCHTKFARSNGLKAHMDKHIESKTRLKKKNQLVE